MLRRRAAHALLRTESMAVRVNLKTGQLTHAPPPLVFESSKASRKTMPPTTSDSSTLADSFLRINRALAEGELRATQAIINGVRHLQSELLEEEEALLLEEADRLGLA